MAGICDCVFGIVHRHGCWGDQIGRIGLAGGFSNRLSPGRFEGLDRFEFSDALQKYAFEFSERLRVMVGLRALFDLQEGQAQGFQRLMSRASFDRGNHS